ncbi:hypothetical protein ABIE69_002587 [Rhodobacteraceae bacterium MBR-64]|jgi:hypothetical protein
MMSVVPAPGSNPVAETGGQTTDNVNTIIETGSMNMPGAIETAQTMSIAIQGAGSPLDGKLSVPLSFI